MDKCSVCGTTAGYKLVHSELVEEVPTNITEYMCLEHAVDELTANKTVAYTLEALPHTRKLGDFYNTGGYISAS